MTSVAYDLIVWSEFQSDDDLSWSSVVFKSFLTKDPSGKSALGPMHALLVSMSMVQNAGSARNWSYPGGSLPLPSGGCVVETVARARITDGGVGGSAIAVACTWTTPSAPACPCGAARLKPVYIDGSWRCWLMPGGAGRKDRFLA